MLFKIGFVIFALGVMMADIENLIIPFAVVSVGLAIMWLGKEANGNEEG